MDEFIKKLIEKLEEVQNYACFPSDFVSEEQEEVYSYFRTALTEILEFAKEYTSTEYINSSTDDLISRSVLMDRLKKWKFTNEERGYDTAKDLIQEMIDLVKEQESVSSNDGWISCSEKMPKPGKRYLVSAVWADEDFRKPAVYDAVYGSDGLWHTYNYEPVSYEVVAWQPLPEPYQPEGRVVMAKKCENCGNENIEIINKDGDYSCGRCGRNTARMKELSHKTNADRIRAMSDEELAAFLVDVETQGYYDQSVAGTLEMIEWLQLEAEE